MSHFTTGYTQGAMGVSYAQMTVGKEDDLFFSNPKITQWKQEWSTYTPHYSAMIYTQLANNGCGRVNVGDMARSPDLWWTTYFMMFAPAILPNAAAGVVDCSYVNAPVIYAQKKTEVKLGSQILFPIDHMCMFLLDELTGMLEMYAEHIGYCKTRAQLKADAKKDRILGCPMFGLPLMETARAFNIGSIVLHSVKWETTTRNITEMFLNYGNVSSSTLPLPIVVSTGSALVSDSIEFGLFSNMVWLSRDERLTLTQFREVMFREMLQVGEKTISAATKEVRELMDVDMKGPTTTVILVLQSEDDMTSGNWTKLCANDGSDYLKEFMLITGNIGREDGMPAQFYRGAKVLDSWNRKLNHHIYIMSFETDARNPQPTGHQNMTNVDKLRCSMLLAPHSMPLVARCYQINYNGYWTDKGTGGRVWG